MASAAITAVPKFPCRLDKRPLVPNGFHGARTDVDDTNWVLVGIPTGRISGFDVLDVDVEGMDWLTGNIDKLPPTRVQTTRSGGKHYFFRHAVGLRCSAGRIAVGMDVRADGGFIIDWSREGLPVEEREIVDWPEGVLTLAKRPGNSRRNLAQSNHSPIGISGPSAPVGTSMLWRLNPADYRDHSDWVRLMMAAHAAGIDRGDWIRWCVSDPAYADEAGEVGRRWDNLMVDRITGWALKVEIRLQELNRGICPKQHKPMPHGIELCEGPLKAPTKTNNLQHRVSSLLRELETGNERRLYWVSCVMREIIAEGLITPRVAVELLCGAWPKKKKPEVDMRRVIASGFLTVEEKLQ